MRPLPYPGYSWSFTQHAIGTEADTLYKFLSCASLYEGSDKDYGQKINLLMVADGVLTANVRDGVVDAWRDYQQILAELGLIYSTKLNSTLRLTEAAHMYLAGELGYSDLMGVQALRYQYPNGQKYTIQSRLSAELYSANITQPSTLLELQMQAGVLVKPGTLLLRILTELYKLGKTPSITVDECLAFVLPCRKNEEWPDALAEIIADRKKSNRISSVHLHARRNIQDWFSFLHTCDLFVRNQNTLSLTQNAVLNIVGVTEALSAEEDIISFWIPTSYDIASRLQWFDWFGHIGLSVQKIASDALDEDYIAKNFVGGLEDDDVLEEQNFSSEKNIALLPLDLDALLRQREFKPTEKSGQEMLEKINLGAFRRHSKTILHNRIVAVLAKKLAATGATLKEDRNSVDLLAQWDGKKEAIFEVKTVTMRSLPNRLRMAVGQIEEYAFRRSASTKQIPDKFIVINTLIPKEAWQVDFLLNSMNIGLLCTDSDSVLTGYPPPNCSTSSHWL
jgi:hypothetical protein